MAEPETPKSEEAEESPILSESGAFANLIDASRMSAAQQEASPEKAEKSEDG